MFQDILRNASTVSSPFNTFLEETGVAVVLHRPDEHRPRGSLSLLTTLQLTTKLAPNSEPPGLGARSLYYSQTRTIIFNRLVPRSNSRVSDETGLPVLRNHQICTVDDYAKTVVTWKITFRKSTFARTLPRASSIRGSSFFPRLNIV